MNKINTRLIKQIEVMHRHTQSERLIQLLHNHHQQLLSFPVTSATFIEKIVWTMYYLQGYLYENDYDVLRKLFALYTQLLTYLQTNQDYSYRLCISTLRDELKEEFVHVYGFH